MTTELTKPVSRRRGSTIITIGATGVRLRAAGRRLAVEVTWEQVAKVGLENLGVSLFEREWDRPLEQLERLGDLVARKPAVRRRKSGQPRKPRITRKGKS